MEVKGRQRQTCTSTHSQMLPYIHVLPHAPVHLHIPTSSRTPGRPTPPRSSCKPTLWSHLNSGRMYPHTSPH